MWCSTHIFASVLFMEQDTQRDVVFLVRFKGSICFFQVVLRENQTTNEGSDVANDLMRKLNVSEEDLITCAYIDLLCQQQRKK